MRTAIIGAGINGLYLAWKLSGGGHEVTVFEKKDKIGKEACSGLFSERILKFIPQSEKLIQNKINFTLMHFPRKTIKVDFAKKFFVMSHADLDRLVADLAQNSGAKIVLECDMAYSLRSPYSSLRPSTRLGARTRHTLTPSFISRIALSSDFDRVIGCDGANSEVRKFLKLPQPEYRLGILGFIPVTDNSNWVEVWPVRNGFLWKIPRGQTIEYGIIANSSEAKKLLDDFCQKNNLQLQNIKSALIPQGFIIPKNNKITLCGDSAGLTKPWSGGGVIWGLQAADLLLKNFPNMLKYRQSAKKAFYFKIFSSRFIVKAVYFMGLKFSWLLPNRIKIEGDKLL